MYRPAVVMVPVSVVPPVTPFTCHAVETFIVPLTLAVNCCCWPAFNVAVVG